MILLTALVGIVAVLLFILVFGWIISTTLALTVGTFLFCAAFGASFRWASFITLLFFLFYAFLACILIVDKHKR
jgi:hypothetical protein